MQGKMHGTAKPAEAEAPPVSNLKKGLLIYRINPPSRMET